ncbi:MAG TPA: signal peptidase I, partial [Kineosporiaceae bacterium]|nr:signal peptidase I [Kineosporiaceae bacterium]
RHRGPDPRRSWRYVDLAAVCLDALQVVAAGVLLVGVLLSGCALVPRLAGWTAVVVTSGSMAPAVQVGDVVVADPGAVARVRPGQIVVVRQPDRGGSLLTHRVAQILPDGDLITHGDANAVNDAVAVPRGRVLGVARLVVPYLGRLALSVRDPDRQNLTWAGAVVAAALFAALRPVRRRPPVPGHGGGRPRSGT